MTPALAFLAVVALGGMVMPGSLPEAGEILILEGESAVPGDRNKEASRRLSERARQEATGRHDSGTVVYVLDPATGMYVPATDASPTDRLRREAREYIEPSGAGTAEDGTPVILRAAPISNTERSRLKARSYLQETGKAPAKDCKTTTNAVGTIGEGSDARKSESVIERGGSVVNPNCR